MAKLALRWRKRNWLVSQVAPDSGVRVESLRSEDAGGQLTVYEVPERLLRRTIMRLCGRAGVPVTPLVFDSEGEKGALSELWKAAQLPPEQTPTRYVARCEDGATSGPLVVTKPVTFQLVDSMKGKAGMIAPVGPVVATGGVEVSRQHSIQGQAYGVIDPEVELRWMTSAGGDLALEGFLDPYLASLEERFDLDAGRLAEAFKEEYRDCFEEPARVGAEFRPSTFEVRENESVEVEIDLFPQTAGRALAAIAIVNESGETVSRSELFVLSHSEDGLLFCE